MSPTLTPCSRLGTVPCGNDGFPLGTGRSGHHGAACFQPWSGCATARRHHSFCCTDSMNSMNSPHSVPGMGRQSTRVNPTADRTQHHRTWRGVQSYVCAPGSQRRTWCCTTPTRSTSRPCSRLGTNVRCSSMLRSYAGKPDHQRLLHEGERACAFLSPYRMTSNMESMSSSHQRCNRWGTD